MSKTLVGLIAMIVFLCGISVIAWAALVAPIADMPTAVEVKASELLSVIDGMLDALRKGNVAEAYQRYTSPSFRTHTSLKQFKEIVSTSKPLSHNKLFQYESFYIEEGIATFEGDLVSEGGDSVAAEFDLEYDQGQWKIMGFDLFHFEITLPPPTSI